MLKRILVGLAGTEYTDVAIRQAVELATLHNAELTGVTVLDPVKLAQGQSIPIGGGEAAVQFREHKKNVTQQRLEEATSSFVEQCESAGVKHHLEHEEGDAFKQMLSYSRYHDVTIFGLRSIFEYFFEDEDSSAMLEGLIRGGVRPIVAVSKEYRPIRRALIAYSGSVESAKAMRRFMQIQLWPDLKLKIVTFDDSREPPETLLDDAAKYCSAFGEPPEIEHIATSAKTGLLPHAEDWNADLIVLGNSARSLLMRKMFGETALHVMQNADRPLFLAQ